MRPRVFTRGRIKIIWKFAEKSFFKVFTFLLRRVIIIEQMFTFETRPKGVYNGI